MREQDRTIVPRVSVLMTVFNTEAYLRASIDSVLSQTLEDFELIIVDDCSSDGSWPMVTAAAARDRRIVAIRRDRQGGASAALNSGLLHASGTYLTRQDSDDLSTPTRLAEQVAFLERHPEVGAAGTAVLLVDAAGNQLGTSAFPETDREIQPALLDYMCFCGPTVMMRRTAFEAAGLSFDESLSGSEDYDLCLRLGEVGSLANVPLPLYVYRQHASSVSHAKRSQQLVRKAQALEKALHRRFGSAPPSAGIGYVARDYLRAAVIGHAMRESRGTRDLVERAVSLEPGLLLNAPLVEKIVRKYTPSGPVGAALTFTESLFKDVFPPTRSLNRLKRRLIAELHMREVFAASQGGDASAIRAHLWPAIRSNPSWLTNRGVFALLGASLHLRNRVKAVIKVDGRPF
jgi:glycosyltransferase involved in cell wall biosynthesis